MLVLSRSEGQKTIVGGNDQLYAWIAGELQPVTVETQVVRITGGGVRLGQKVVNEYDENVRTVPIHREEIQSRVDEEVKR